MRLVPSHAEPLEPPAVPVGNDGVEKPTAVSVDGGAVADADADDADCAPDRPRLLALPLRAVELAARPLDDHVVDELRRVLERHAVRLREFRDRSTPEPTLRLSSVSAAVPA